MCYWTRCLKITLSHGIEVALPSFTLRFTLFHSPSHSLSRPLLFFSLSPFGFSCTTIRFSFHNAVLSLYSPSTISLSHSYPLLPFLTPIVLLSHSSFPFCSLPFPSIILSSFHSSFLRTLTLKSKGVGSTKKKTDSYNSLKKTKDP